MNRSFLIAASLALNLVLAGAVTYQFLQPAAPVPSPEPAAKVVPSAPPKRTFQKSETPVATNPPFTWSNLESEDYRNYIANLRAIGCPEETIRDIIVTDVEKLFASRLAALGEQARKFSFWQAGVSRNKLNADLRRQARQLAQEKWTLVKGLLGGDVQSDYFKTTFNPDYLTDELTLGFLPEGRRPAVRDILERYGEMESELQQRMGRNPGPKDRTEMKRLQDQRRAELASVLSPQELEEYELRTSSAAESLRSRLAGLTLSEDQFRKLHHAQKAFDDEFSQGGEAKTPITMEKRLAVQRQLGEQFKEVLGEANYNDWQRGQDPTYRGLVDVARDFGLSNQTVDKVYETKKAVDEAMRQLMTTPGVSGPERIASLRTIAQDAEKALVDTLGPKAFEAYKQNGGHWIPSATNNTFTITSGSGDNVSVFKFGGTVDRSTSGTSPGAGQGQILVQPKP